MKKPFFINRLKVVLAEKRLHSKQLAARIGVSEGTVSKWCVNKQQPPLERLREIALDLDVDIKDLLNSTKKNL